MTPGEAEEAFDIMDVFHTNYPTIGDRRSLNGNYRWPRERLSSINADSRRRTPEHFYMPAEQRAVLNRAFILLVRVSTNLSVLTSATSRSWDPVPLDRMKVQCVFWVRDNGTKCLTDLTDGKVWELQ